MSSMRVLAVTNMYPTSSNPPLGSFVEQQIKGLRSVGLDVDVLFIDRQQRGMATYRHVPTQLRARLRHSDPDLVHVMYGGVMANLTTRVIRDRPTVITFHGSDLLGEHFSGKFRRLVAAYGVSCSLKAARRADGVVVVAESLEQRLPADIDRGKVRIIPCGIDTGHFVPLPQSRCREQLNWRGDSFRILFNIAGDVPRKQPGLARAAVAALNRSGIRAEMHELHSVPNQDVPVWLNASDVLLLTSQQEGSPTIVKEALACNLPVVSLDVGDVRKQIDGIDGCHLAAANPDDLADKLKLVYAGPRRVNGRFKMETLSLERVASRLKVFYEELLGKIPPRALVSADSSISDQI